MLNYKKSKTASYLFTAMFVVIIFAVAVFSLPVLADSDATISVETIAGAVQGESVTVPVTVSSNVDVIAAQFWVKYDSGKLTLTSADVGTMLSDIAGGEEFISTELEGLVYFSWDSTTSFIDNDGTVLVLTFTIKSGASGKADISVNEAEEIFFYDQNYNEIEMQKVSGGVLIFSEVRCGDGLMWTVTPESELIISGTGDMYDYASSDVVPWASFASEISNVILPSGITSIGDNAFSDCKNVSSVSYEGTVSQWTGLTLGVNNQLLEEAYYKSLPGNINSDRAVDATDLVLLVKYIVGSITEINRDNADVNNDSNVDILDVVRLMRYLAGYKVELAR